MKLRSTREASTNGIKVLVYGPAGAGKTTLCATIENAMIISAEGGLLSLRGYDIPFVEVASMGDLIEVYRFVSESQEASQFDWICLDSISEVAEVVLAYEKKQTKDPRQAYGALQDQMGGLIRDFRDLSGKNVYFSCKQERIKDDVSGSLLYGPSMPGAKLAQSIPYFFDEVFALRVEKDDQGAPTRWLQTSIDPQFYCKDRSGALAMFEPPNLGDIAKKINPTTNPLKEVSNHG